MVAGRVRVNGEPATELGIRVDPTRDRVELDGRPVVVPGTRWILLNKPRGYLTTAKDPRGRRTVYDLLSERDRSLRYVGRLDRQTEGLLLFTNEGDLHNKLLHPSSELPRRYRVAVEDIPDRRVLRALEEGVELEDGPASAEDVRMEGTISDGRVVVSLTVREGRNREVRRMFEAVGLEVARLRRIAFGPIRLGSLPRGSWRPLDGAEIDALRKAV